MLYIMRRYIYPCTVSLILVSAFALAVSGCMVQQHIVGSGGKGVVSESTKQWYVLWGLVPINKIDEKAMVGGATDYTIRTSTEFIDGLITTVLSGIVTARTVTVTK